MIFTQNWVTASWWVRGSFNLGYGSVTGKKYSRNGLHSLRLTQDRLWSLMHDVIAQHLSVFHLSSQCPFTEMQTFSQSILSNLHIVPTLRTIIRDILTTCSWSGTTTYRVCAMEVSPSLIYLASHRFLNFVSFGFLNCRINFSRSYPPVTSRAKFLLREEGLTLRMPRQMNGSTWDSVGAVQFASASG